MVDTTRTTQRIVWYRSPVSREDMRRLNQRSDLKGFLQAGGFLMLLAATATAAVLSVGRLPWYIVELLVYFHGSCWAFLVNGFHELVHDSVFKTHALNTFFLRVVSFLGGYNPHFFWASHTEHHKYTLHPPDDLEVVLPINFTLKDIFLRCLVSPSQLWVIASTNIRHAFGRLEGPWENALFPASEPMKRREMFNWASIVVAGHAAIAIISLALGWWLHAPRLWLLPVLITLTPSYRGWLHFLCNQAQHTGLQDNASDFRLCCRTMIINPFFRFLYWHMNFHTEHHMYAAVPCYNLGKLHEIIKDDLPDCPRGLFATWKQIIAILRQQRTQPGYQFIPTLPGQV